MRFKSSTCTTYVIQRGPGRPKFLGDNIDGWGSFANAWMFPTRDGALEVAKKQKRPFLIVTVRCRTMSPRTRASKKRTG